MMKTQYIKPEIQMVLLENMLMASNSTTGWTVDNANKSNDPENNDHGPIFGPYDDWKPNFKTDPFDSNYW